MFVRRISRRFDNVGRRSVVFAMTGVLLATGVFAGFNAATASAADACTRGKAVVDPNVSPPVMYARWNCDLAERAVVRTSPNFPNGATNTNEDMEAIGYMAPGRRWVACQVQWDWRSEKIGSADRQSTWWLLTRVDSTPVRDNETTEQRDKRQAEQQRWEQLDGWGWVSAAAMADYVAPKNGKDQPIANVPTCGTPEARWENNDGIAGNDTTTQAVDQRPTQVKPAVAPAARPATPAARPAAPATPATPPECVPGGKITTPGGKSLTKYTCDVLKPADKPNVDVYGYNPADANKVVGYLNPGKSWFVCQSVDRPNPATKNSNGSTNNNNRWLLTISDGPQEVWGGVAATSIAQGNSNQPVPPVPACPAGV